MSFPYTLDNLFRAMNEIKIAIESINDIQWERVQVGPMPIKPGLGYQAFIQPDRSGTITTRGSRRELQTRLIISYLTSEDGSDPTKTIENGFLTMDKILDKLKNRVEIYTHVQRLELTDYNMFFKDTQGYDGVAVDLNYQVWIQSSIQQGRR